VYESGSWNLSLLFLNAVYSLNVIIPGSDFWKDVGKGRVAAVFFVPEVTITVFW